MTISKYAVPAMALAIVGASSAISQTESTMSEPHRNALEGNQFFYGQNWKLSEPQSVADCADDVIRCFENGYCATMRSNGSADIRAIDGYSLVSEFSGGDMVLLRRIESWDFSTLDNPSPYAHIFLPPQWELPTKVEFFNIRMDLEQIRDDLVVGTIIEVFKDDQTGAKQATDRMSDLNFHQCVPADTKQIDPTSADTARYVMETYEGFAELAADYDALIGRTNGIVEAIDAKQKASQIDADQISGMLSDQCSACSEFRQKLHFLTQAVYLAQGSENRWKDIHHEVTSFVTTHNDMLDQIEAYIADDLSDFIASQEAQLAQVEAIELQAEAEREEKREQQAANETAIEAELEAFFADSVKVLTYNYHNYMVAHSCFDARKSMLIQYVNATDLDRARLDIEAIETHLTSMNEALDAEDMWDKTSEQFGDLSATTPLPIIAKLGTFEEAVFATQQQLFQGSTGSLRQVNFEALVRNSSDNELIKQICQNSVNTLATQRVKLISEGDAEPRAKDF